MIFLVCFAFTVLLTQSCVGKPAQFKGYPEENRNVKNPFSADLFQGDMLVEPEVKKIALAGGDVSKATAGRKRGAPIPIPGRIGIWPKGVIPYLIDSSLDAQKDKIKSVMKEWENGTCLSFVPFVSGGSMKVYLHIRGDYLGCFASRGYVDISQYRPGSSFSIGTPLNLGPSCYERRTIRHELGHAIGFYHEQSRPDRDSYVTVLTDHIMPGKMMEFQKFSNSLIDSLGSPYDLTSVMHYGPKSYSENGKNTIESVDPAITLVVNENISDLDKEQVNKLYNCT